MTNNCAVSNEPGRKIPLQDDKTIMNKIRSIVGRGNNAEIKKRKDGSLAVMEVKKNIV